MARSSEGFQCHVHRSLVSYEIHHVWPREYHGPNTKDNLVKICPNAHSDVHYLLQRMLTGKSYDLSEYGPNVRAIAQRGRAAIMAYGERMSATYTTQERP